MGLFEKQAGKLTASQNNLQMNIERISAIQRELGEIPEKLSALEVSLAKAGQRERYPIFELRNHRDQIITELNGLQAENVGLGRIVRWEQELASAPAVIKAAPKRIQSAQKELSRLDASLGKLSQKLAAMKAASEQSEATAIEAEKAAAKAYAEAMAGDDPAAENAALLKLQRATADAEGPQARANSLVINALEAEHRSLESAVADATADLQNLEAEQVRAVRVMLDAQWDEKAKELISLAARIVATGPLGGGNVRHFDALHIPLTSRIGRDSITRHEIEREASTLPREALTHA
jgi:chromosome segregation ATPase